MRVFRMLFPALTLALGACVLGACSSTQWVFSDSPETHWLNAPGHFSPDLSPVGATLLIERPQTQASYDTSRLVVQIPPTEFDNVVGMAWSDRLPSMQQILLVEGFENAGLNGVLHRKSAMLPTDFILQSEIRSFAAILAGPHDNGQLPEIRVRMSFRLINTRKRQIVDFRSIESVQPLKRLDSTYVIKGFDQANQRVLTEAIEWAMVKMAQVVSGPQLTNARAVSETRIPPIPSKSEMTAPRLESTKTE